MNISKQQMAKEENIVNAISNSNATNTISNIAENNISEETGLKEVEFTVSSIEQTTNGYRIYAHVLANELRKVTAAEYNNVLNGQSITFRGKEFVFNKKDEYWTFLKEKDTGKDIGVALSPVYENQVKQDYYTFWNIAGKETMIKDYESDEITTFDVDSSCLAGSSFDNFKYNFKMRGIEATDYLGNEVKDRTIPEFIERMEGVYDTMTSAGECIGFMYNGKIIVIHANLGTAP
jgi:hypothetical protein